mmetsp:Transcript_26350/g.54620  ORF Transcript_26350/g.54620 Transcript_26350/m.54620 type:complete len:235 (+) Transcript_26350:276-980(+)
MRLPQRPAAWTSAELHNAVVRIQCAHLCEQLGHRRVQGLCRAEVGIVFHDDDVRKAAQHDVIMHPEVSQHQCLHAEIVFSHCHHSLAKQAPVLLHVQSLDEFRVYPIHPDYSVCHPALGQLRTQSLFSPRQARVVHNKNAPNAWHQLQRILGWKGVQRIQQRMETGFPAEGGFCSRGIRRLHSSTVISLLVAAEVAKSGVAVQHLVDPFEGMYRQPGRRWTDPVHQRQYHCGQR